MSIALAKTIENFTSVNDYDNLKIIPYSDTYYQNDAYYLFKTYVKTAAPSTYKLLSTDKYYPLVNPDDALLNTRCEFNPSTILKSQFSYDPQPTLKTVYINTSQIKDFKIEVTDYYNSGLNSGGTVTITGTCNNAVGQFKRYVESASPNNYKPNVITYNSGSVGKFLTNYTDVAIPDNKWNTLQMIVENPLDTRLAVRYEVYYTSSGGTATTKNIDVSLTQTSNMNKYIQIPASYRNLQTLFSGDTALSTWSLINIYVINQIISGGTYSNTITLHRVTNECTSRYGEYQLYFTNELGGWDTMIFDKKNIVTGTIERLDYKKRLRPNYNTYDAGQTNINTTVDEEWTLNTSLLETDADVAKFLELLKSPNVYIILNDELYSVNVLDTEYLIKTVVNGDVLQYPITIKFSNRLKKY
jgi:hypothetical protein